MMTVYYCFVNYASLYTDHETHNVEDRQQLQSDFRIFSG